ncbi:hypothetical protein CR513_48899, partial [Mucuna pruriens]
MLDDGGYDNHFGNLVVARGEKISKLYQTKALFAKDSVNAMDMEAFLWHRRLSHISEKWLNCLAKKDMLPGLKNVELEKYSHCMAVSFKKHPASRKSEFLELVHSNVCGPLKALVERQSGKKVKCIHFDNGGQYCRLFDTPSKTPQLNGLVERMNRTLIERDRRMLSKARSKHKVSQPIKSIST